jgi:hypothetical protein
MHGPWLQQNVPDFGDRALHLDDLHSGGDAVASTVAAFLLSWGESTMASCFHGNNANLALVAESSNRLGWDSLVEGRISSHWLPLVAPILCRRSQYLLPPAWG